jgi:hypothetical protein
MADMSDSEAVNPTVAPANRTLGVTLRDMFDCVANGPMPQHLVELVDQLERAYEARQTEAGLGEPRGLGGF